jgi:hypothetical protein
MFMLPVFFIREPVPAVVPPFMEVPVVVLLAAVPPACELPPAVLPPACARASVLVIAKAAAKPIVLIFMGRFLSGPTEQCHGSASVPVCLAK